jgi:hypothetical protein
MSVPPTMPAPQPKKLEPWVIIIVIIVVACCFCFGAIGMLLAFGGPILTELGLNAILPLLMAIP